MSEILKKRYADPIKGEETRRKISEGGKGKKRSEATRKKMSEASKLRAPASEETRKKIREAWELRAPASEETRKKMSEAGKLRAPRTLETLRKQSDSQRGEKGSNWKGGISFFPYCQKFNKEFKERVRAFFNHQCIECGSPQKGKKLAIHHVNFDKQSCCNDTVPLFVPLCPSCHSKTNYKREYWEQHFTEMINNYYGGKCYYLKEEMTEIKLEKLQ